MTLAEIFCAILVAIVSVAAAVALGLGLVVCINYIENLFTNRK